MEPEFLKRKREQEESQQNQAQNKDAAAKLKELLLKKLQKTEPQTTAQQPQEQAPEEEKPIIKADLKAKFKEEFEKKAQKEEQEINQTYMSEARKYKIDMGKQGYKQRYYKEKFQIDPKDFFEFQANIKQHYIEGLCWNYAYYYRGCISWNWYYPYHYSPFASDITSLGNLQIKFDIGTPFRPIDQLLAVLSPLSAEAVPKCFRPLMTDDDSEIIDFYPKTFISDTKGKRYAWLAEVILPFLDESRLLNAISSKIDDLDKEEKKRNQPGFDFIYMNNFNQSYLGLKEHNSETYNKINEKIALNFSEHDFTGNIKVIKPIQNQEVLQSICFQYESPEFTRVFAHLLEGAILPPSEITSQSFQQTDRKFFAGEKVIRMLERSLGIAQQSGRHHFEGQQQYGTRRQTNWSRSYNNNICFRMPQSDPYTYKTEKAMRQILQKDDQQLRQQINKSMDQEYEVNRFSALDQDKTEIQQQKNDQRLQSHYRYKDQQNFHHHQHHHHDHHHHHHYQQQERYQQKYNPINTTTLNLQDQQQQQTTLTAQQQYQNQFYQQNSSSSNTFFSPQTIPAKKQAQHLYFQNPLQQQLQQQAIQQFQPSQIDVNQLLAQESQKRSSNQLPNNQEGDPQKKQKK